VTLHIQRFIDRVQCYDNRNTRDFVMPLQDARDLHGDITRLLLQVSDLQEHVIRLSQSPESLTVSVSGGGFK
jgi:hypothetical protein